MLYLKFSIYSRKRLRAKQTNVIPPHKEDVYVDLQYRSVPEKYHVVPGCITKFKKSVLSVINVSNSYVEKSVVARGYICRKQNYVSEETSFTIQQNKLERFKLIEVEKLIDYNSLKKKKLQLLDLLNKYRACFATKTSELGTCDVSEIEIKLLDDRPVTYPLDTSWLYD